MADEIDEEPGPIGWTVVELPAGPGCFDGEMAAELSLLVECELIRIIDVVFIAKAVTGGLAVLELDEAGETGELRVGGDDKTEVLALEDLENVARAMTPGTSAGVLVWEHTWAAPFDAAARRSGGRLLDGGPLAVDALISAVAVDDAADPTLPGRAGRASHRGVIGRPVARSSGQVETTIDLAQGAKPRQTEATAGGKRVEIVEPDPCHQELKDARAHGH